MTRSDAAASGAAGIKLLTQPRVLSLCQTETIEEWALFGVITVLVDALVALCSYLLLTRLVLAANSSSKPMSFSVHCPLTGAGWGQTVSISLACACGGSRSGWFTPGWGNTEKVLPPCSSSFALCPLRSLGTIMSFQARAKLNLPHKLIAQHFKGVRVCVLGLGVGGQRQEVKDNNNKAANQTELCSHTMC